MKKLLVALFPVLMSFSIHVSMSVAERAALVSFIFNTLIVRLEISAIEDILNLIITIVGATT